MAAVKPWGTKDTDDIFGLLAITHGAGTLADIMHVKPVTRDPIAQNVSVAKDEAGDIVAKTVTAIPGTMFDATVDYELISGTLDLSDLFIGQCATAGTVIGSIAVKTGNGQWPVLSVSGVVGKTLELTVDGKQNKWSLPAISVSGLKLAQSFGGGGSAGLGFTAPTGTKTTGSGVTFTATIDEAPDGEGVPVAFSISGCDGTMTGEFVAYDNIEGFLPTVTVDTATGYLWKVTKNTTTSKPSAEYWTGSFEATIIDPATALPRLASV